MTRTLAFRVPSLPPAPLRAATWLLLGCLAAAGATAGEAPQGVPQDEYLVIPFPAENPNDVGGEQITLTGPADPQASPFGWHDTDGIPDAEFNDTRGNNVDVQALDGFRPTGGAGPELAFDYPLDLSLPPDEGTNLEASIVALFYNINFLHDFAARYGFDEAAGNFQTTNYSGTGLGGDAVVATAQRGTSCDNFGTPPDGTAPVQSSCLWQIGGGDGDFPRDASHDKGIVTFGYARGIALRLTGGPANVKCLFGDEMGQTAWSDFLHLVTTAKAEDGPGTPRTMGTWIFNQPIDGEGIRPFPYTTDLTLNPQTFGDLGSVSVPHGVSSIWASMMWEVYWELVLRYGFDEDLLAGSGGNNLAIQLIFDGMKLQPCIPTFVHSRNAILQADNIVTGGANQCAIWRGFAKRGLGLSATSGSPLAVGDEVEAFDLPASCDTLIFADGFEFGGCAAWSSSSSPCG